MKLLIALLFILAFPPAVTAGGTDTYLAYRVRIARGEAHSKLDAGLSRLAERRAIEVTRSFNHRHLGEVPCRWGEILGWTTSPSPISWLIRAWHRSPTHEAVLMARWTRYGVATTVKDGRLFAVVIFANCSMKEGDHE